MNNLIVLAKFLIFQTPTGSLKEVLEQLLEAVVSHADPAGRLVSDLFQKLPSKVVSLSLLSGVPVLASEMFMHRVQ